MNKLFSKIIGASLAIAMMIGVGAGMNANKAAKEVNADPGDEISAIANIISGNDYYIKGVRNSGGKQIVEYLTFADAAGTQSGTSATTTENAVKLTFTAVTGGYNITTPLGNYIAPGTSNGKINVSTSPIVVTATNQSSKIRLSIVSGSNTWSIQKNNSGTNFGGYKNTQNDITLIDAGSASATVDSVSVSGDMTNKNYNTVESWDNTGLIASVNMSDDSQYSGPVTWGYSPSSPAELAKNTGDEVTNGVIRATASASGKNGYKDVSGITVNYATVAELTAATPATGLLENIIVKGIISQIGEVSTQHGNATYFISDDGTTTDQYEVYRGKGLNEADFTNVNDIQVGDIVVIFGNAKTYNSTKELDTGNYLLSLDRPASTEPSITIVNTGFTFKVGDANVELEANAENIPEGGSVAWESSDLTVATIVQTNQTFSVHAVAAGTTTITAKILNIGGEPVASNTIEVKVLEQLLENGDSFIIKAVRDETTYYLTSVSASNYGTVGTNSSEAMIFTAIEGTNEGQFQFKNGDDYYLSYSGSSNAVYVTDSEESDSTFWTALYDGNGTIVESVKVAGRRLRYNHSDSRFACYTTAQTAIELEKVAAVAINTVSASLANRTYYENTQLTASDFTVTVTWTGGKSDTQPTSGFTWTVNGVENGTLTAGSNTVVVTYAGESSESIVINAQAQNARMYLNNTNKVFSISGEEETSGTPEVTADITLADQGFTNNTAVNGSYSIDSNATLTLSNGCKYYDSGAAVRVYAGNSFTVSSSIVITRIVATWDGSDKPNAATIVNTGTYTVSTNTWTGSATSVTFTRPSGSGHWKLKALEVTYGDATVTVDHVELRFGASIPQTDWANINSNWAISDYGVMFMKKTTLQNSYQGKSIAEAYEDGLRPNANVHKGSGEVPYEEGDNYVFTGKINMTNVNNYDIVYVAAPYIVAGGEIFFLQEIEYSVNTMAQYYLSHSGSNLSNAALTILAGNQGD